MNNDTTNTSCISEIKSENGWQNIGRARIFARKNIPKKLLTVYMTIVDFSIGFTSLKTHHKTISWFSEESGVSRKTWIIHTKMLDKLGFIKIVTSDLYIDGGGSIPNAYSIVFKVNGNDMGHILIKGKENIKQSDSKNNAQLKYDNASIEIKERIDSDIKYNSKKRNGKATTIEKWFIEDSKEKVSVYQYFINKETTQKELNTFPEIL